ncbi:hypothetical protein BV22DRAFT_737205 [Leucogyrophana mollusca]|uniref:Uncharacterized protein n=1 Tax=Leucogyrophana mollusca TaxID=85980 RepID=A0ACB8B6Y1_9AGAM|nr:hypothetical protein BV22DRAFT_737205 [Leucogyrophana mollusca]
MERSRRWARYKRRVHQREVRSVEGWRIARPTIDSRGGERSAKGRNLKECDVGNTRIPLPSTHCATGQLPYWRRRDTTLPDGWVLILILHSKNEYGARWS